MNRLFFALVLILGIFTSTGFAQPAGDSLDLDTLLLNIREASKEVATTPQVLPLTEPLLARTPEQWAEQYPDREDFAKVVTAVRYRAVVLARLNRFEETVTLLGAWLGSDAAFVTTLSKAASGDYISPEQQKQYMDYIEGRIEAGEIGERAAVIWYQRMTHYLHDRSEAQRCFREVLSRYARNHAGMGNPIHAARWVKNALDRGFNASDTTEDFQLYLQNNDTGMINRPWLRALLPVGSPLMLLTVEKPDDLVAALAETGRYDPLTLMQFRKQLVDGGDLRLLAVSDTEKAWAANIPTDTPRQRWVKAMLEGRFQDAAREALTLMVADVADPDAYTLVATSALVPAIRCGSQSYNEPANTALQALGGQDGNGNVVEPDYTKIEKIINALSNE